MYWCIRTERNEWKTEEHHKSTKGKVNHSNYDDNCTTHHFQSRTYKISGRLIFVGQSVQFTFIQLSSYTHMLDHQVHFLLTPQWTEPPGGSQASRQAGWWSHTQQVGGIVQADDKGVVQLLLEDAEEKGGWQQQHVQEVEGISVHCYADIPDGGQGVHLMQLL